MNIVNVYLVILVFIIWLSLVSEVWRWYSSKHLGVNDDTFEIFEEGDGYASRT